ncbi:MAG: hypothetical protein HNEKOMLI_00398 [Sodalis sp. Psp]|nr:hypothetical protein [Sodalis sp. Psp]MCR3756882.1 hypothetical protein [Sodalis sp. Ppy]
MTWEYMLIGLVVGVIIGTVAMRFGNCKLRQQKTLQYELEKSKAELDEYREKLTKYFVHSAELLDNMADDYRQLYQYMAKSSNNLMPDKCVRNNSLLTEVDSDQTPEKMQPRDYPENANELLRSTRGLRK